MNRAVFLSIGAGVLGLLVGRALPREAPAPGTMAGAPLPHSVRAPAVCTAERAQLSSVRAQLAVCMASRTTPAEDASPPPPTGSTPTALAALPEGFRALITQAYQQEGAEVVFVREPLPSAREGGATFYRTRAYAADEWSPDGGSGRIFMQRHSDGSLDWYDAPTPARDLIGPGGVVTPEGTRIRIRFLESDGGSP